ncbi:MAG: hypothetical protein J0L92_36655 [Deltaproteobacteria bacterium]|nr:hypothetical protein [Deltaproteobacteria bacterium]
MSRRNMSTGRSGGSWYTWGLVLALGLPAVGAQATLLAGCPSTNGRPVAPIVPGESASALIGPEGGMIEVGTMQIAIPAGALTSAQEIRVIVDGAAPPGAFTGFSPVVRFEPEGTSFARPIEVRIPFDGDPALATIFWSQRDGEAYVPRATRVVDGYAIAETQHFSSAFVGTACSGEGCCDTANGELDLLLVVDNSNSMNEEQALLRAQLPRIAQILASGDRDGDGIQDFPALESIHIGVTTTDLGAGDNEGVPTCATGWGDDGLLLDRARVEHPACADIDEPFARYDESDPSSLEAFVHHVDCTTQVGIGGCGFEQQLEATLLAISPSAPTDWTASGWSTPTFLGDRAPHGDGENEGFLRSSSILAVLEVTDENDMSVLDTGVFVAGDPRFAAVPLNLRGHEFSDPSMGVVQPVSRYVDGLAGLRAEPADLVFAAVTGVPSGAISDAANVDYDALAAHAAMSPIVNAMGTNLEPSCSSDNGVAFPPTRIVETARQLDARGSGTVLASICDPTFDALIDGLVERIARRAAGSCE